MTEHQPLNNYPLPLKLRVEDYLLLDAAGAFEAYRKTELIEGEVRFMNAQHRPHSFAKSEIAYRIRRVLEAADSRLYVVVEGSIAIPPHSAPEPDIVLTSAPHGQGLIPVDSVALVVEISDATLQDDLGRKQRLYAEAVIAEYWVADVNARQVHQFWRPENGSYCAGVITKFGECLQASTIDTLMIATDDL